MSLQDLESQHREVLARAEELRRQRDQVIRDALRERTYTKAEIARITGLTRQRIQQIAEEKK